MKKSSKDAPERAPTSIRISKELLKRTQHACVDREVTQTEAIEAGLEWWLNPESIQPVKVQEIQATGREAVYLRRLHMAFESRDEGVIGAITQNIDQFLRITEEPKASKKKAVNG